MENKDQPAFPASASWMDEQPEIIQVAQEGLTKREYFAGRDWGTVPETFYHDKLKEFNDKSGITRSTSGHPGNIMTADEIATVRACWRIKCADIMSAKLSEQ